MTRRDPAFKPGDPPPDGYLAWHSWAHVQDRAGLRQVPCRRCARWMFPQELAVPREEPGGPLCTECAPTDARKEHA